MLRITLMCIQMYTHINRKNTDNYTQIDAESQRQISLFFKTLRTTS